MTGLNWAATGVVLSFSQFTAVLVETTIRSAASRCRSLIDWKRAG